MGLLFLLIDADALFFKLSLNEFNPSHLLLVFSFLPIMTFRQQVEEGIGPLSMTTHLEQNVSYIVPLLLFIILFYGINKQSTLEAPIINPKKRMELTTMSTVNRFMTGSREVMTMGGSMYPDKPYKVYTDWGESLVLPPEFVNELKSHPDLDFQHVSQDVCSSVEDVSEMLLQ